VLGSLGSDVLIPVVLRLCGACGLALARKVWCRLQVSPMRDVQTAASALSCREQCVRESGAEGTAAFQALDYLADAQVQVSDAASMAT
jgi:hypothetical protein